MSRAIIVVGLGYGDEGKGATVDFLCSNLKVSAVAKVSGAHQCAHNVVKDDDTHHCFSQYGAGSLAGVRTEIGGDFIVEPIAMANEMRVLKAIGGNCSINIDGNCPVTTPYEKGLNRCLEASRRFGRHGSCGVGVGETRRNWMDNAGLVYSDLQNPALVIPKLRKIRERCESRLVSEAEGTPIHWHSTFFPTETVYEVAHKLFAAYREVESTSKEMTWGELMVFEGSQGVMLDELYGSQPHTTWSSVTPRNAVEICRVYGIPYVIVGCIRTYQTRHGNGPLRAYSEGLKHPETEHNVNNSWQGPFRTAGPNVAQVAEAVRIFNIDCLSVGHIDAYRESDALRILESLESESGVPIAIQGSGPKTKDRTFTDAGRDMLGDPLLIEANEATV